MKLDPATGVYRATMTPQDLQRTHICVVPRQTAGAKIRPVAMVRASEKASVDTTNQQTTKEATDKDKTVKPKQKKKSKDKPATSKNPKVVP